MSHSGLDHFRRPVLPHQLRPDSVPVIGAQVPAPHSCACGALNVHASLNWHGPVAVLPFGHCWLFDAKRISQRLLATKYGDRLRDALFVICAHAAIIGITYRLSSGIADNRRSLLE